MRNWCWLMVAVLSLMIGGSTLGAETDRTAVDKIAPELSASGEQGRATDRIGDADGAPREDFWAYAIGTLFIRFFGIFLVLGILMLGMMLSGKVFGFMEKRAERRRNSTQEDSASEVPEPLPLAAPAVTPEIVAVIALALHREARPPQTRDKGFRASGVSEWCLSGRSRIMLDRLSVSGRLRFSGGKGAAK